MFEAATNAVRHPGATIIQTASTFFIPKRSLTVRGIVSSLALTCGTLAVTGKEGTVTLLCDDRTVSFRETVSRDGRTRRKRMSLSELALGQSVMVRTRPRLDKQKTYVSDLTLLVSPRNLSETELGLEDESIDSGSLTIVFWDDGQSIVDTLREAISSGKSIRSIEVPDLYADFEVLRWDRKGREKVPQILNSSYLPDLNTPEDLLLLAATFPGITRDVSGAGRERNAEPLSNPVLESPGMGLFVLLNTAIDVFGGTVFFRTKRFGMSVKKALKNSRSPALHYTAKIRDFGDQSPTLLRNMVIIRLPIRERSA